MLKNKKGQYKFGVDQSGDAFAAYSLRSGIYSVSGNIDKDGRLFGVSVSVGGSLKVSGVDLGVKVNLVKLVPFTARQFNDFVGENSGLSGEAFRAIQNRESVLNSAIRDQSE